MPVIRRSLHLFIALLVFSCLCFVLGCTAAEDGDDPPAARTDGGGSHVATAADSHAAAAGQAKQLAGINFQPPQTWRDLGARGMRKASYEFGPVQGDSQPATVAVFYFGPDEGGTVEDNIQRWIGQMSQPDGSDAAAATERQAMTVAGMTAHTVQLSGTYRESMGGPMSGQAVSREGYLLSAVVLEGPQGPVFFKLTGPAKTAQAMSEGFDAMIAAITRGAS